MYTFIVQHWKLARASAAILVSTSVWLCVRVSKHIWLNLYACHMRACAFLYLSLRLCISDCLSMRLFVSMSANTAAMSLHTSLYIICVSTVWWLPYTITCLRTMLTAKPSWVSFKSIIMIIIDTSQSIFDHLLLIRLLWFTKISIWWSRSSTCRSLSGKTWC